MMGRRPKLDKTYKGQSQSQLKVHLKFWEGHVKSTSLWARLQSLEITYLHIFPSLSTPFFPSLSTPFIPTLSISFFPSLSVPFFSSSLSPPFQKHLRLEYFSSMGMIARWMRWSRRVPSLPPVSWQRAGSQRVFTPSWKKAGEMSKGNVGTKVWVGRRLGLKDRCD